MTHRDLFCLLLLGYGFTLIVIACAMVFGPAALVVLGVFLMFFSVISIARTPDTEEALGDVMRNATGDLAQRKAVGS